MFLGWNNVISCQSTVCCVNKDCVSSSFHVSGVSHLIHLCVIVNVHEHEQTPTCAFVEYKRVHIIELSCPFQDE